VKIPRRRALEVLLASTVVAASRPARGAPPGDLLARIAKARAPVRTLQGPFTQTRTIGLLATEVKSTGTLALLRPDRLRWQLAAPDDVTFWVGPEGLAYKSAHGQGRVPASNARVAASLQDLHSLLGGDLSRLNERWTLTVLRDDATGAELEAVRNDADAGASTPRKMRFALAPDLVRPTHALLVEGEHDRTTIDFGELSVNAPLDEASMRPPV
jgi:hypothetical protein